MTPRIIVAVDLDYFYAQCEEIRKPQLKQVPLAVCVYSGRTEISGAVSTTNYLARKFGVKSGIPIANAKRILSGKGGVLLPVDQDYYNSVSDRIMEIVSTYSRKFEQVSVDEAFLDVTDRVAHDWSLARQLGEEIKKDIYDKEQLTCSVGIAPNKLLAKMAADFEKPNGLTIIKPEQISQFLDPQPVRNLIGVGPKIEEKLHKLGVKTIGQLGNFDAEILKEIFGTNLGLQLKNMAQGIDEDPVKRKPVSQLSRIVTLKSDANSFSFEQNLEPLAQSLSEKLVGLGLESKLVGIIAITTELKTKSRAKTLDAYTDTSEVILRTAAVLFSELFKAEEKGPELRRIGIRLGALRSKEDDSKKRSEVQGTLTSFLNS
jgi:DNA polymerase IV (DinB-like DNA polymerase)